jgi:hypothetical protein
MGEHDPLYSMRKRMNYVYKCLYIGAITGGIGSCATEYNSLTGALAGGLVGIILGIGVRALKKD